MGRVSIPFASGTTSGTESKPNPKYSHRLGNRAVLPKQLSEESSGKRGCRGRHYKSAGHWERQSMRREVLDQPTHGRPPGCIKRQDRTAFEHPSHVAANTALNFRQGQAKRTHHT